MGVKRPEPIAFDTDDWSFVEEIIRERDDLRRQLAESHDRERELLAACKSAEWYGCDPISFAKIQAALRDCGEGEGD